MTHSISGWMRTTALVAFVLALGGSSATFADGGVKTVQFTLTKRSNVQIRIQADPVKNAGQFNCQLYEETVLGGQKAFKFKVNVVTANNKQHIAKVFGVYYMKAGTHEVTITGAGYSYHVAVEAAEKGEEGADVPFKTVADASGSN